MRLIIPALLILFAVALPAHADTAKVSWVQPTAWQIAPTDAAGAPITPTPAVTLDHNKVYRGTKADGSDGVLIATITPAATTWTDTAPKVGPNCYSVTASSNLPGALESARSAVVCKTIAPPAVRPMAPTGVKAQ